PPSAARIFCRSAAQGWNGSPPGTPVPAPPALIIQIPDKSAFPSAVRGAGAVRLGLPSAPFGTPTGWSGHCATKGEVNAVTNATNAATNRLMDNLRPFDP